jgi:hypothetical protein
VGAFWKKLPPPEPPPQKILVKAVMLCNLKESMQTMTVFGSVYKKVLKKIEVFDTLYACKFQ